MQSLFFTLVFMFLLSYPLFSQGNPGTSNNPQPNTAREPEQNIPLLSETPQPQPQPQALTQAHATAAAEDDRTGFDGLPKRDYPFLINFPWVTYAGATTIDSALTLTLRSINYPISILTQKTGKMLGSFLFVGKTLLIDTPLTLAAMTFNHEFFGHAARVREAGGTVEKVHISLPWPFGSGGGYTSYYGVNHYDENILVITGGSEANQVMSQGIALRWTKTGIVDSNDFVLYSMTRLDLFFYIQGLNSASGTLASNDVDSYLTLTNNKYGYTSVSGFPLTLQKLKRWSYILLIDPYLYMGLISTIYKQITEKQQFKLPLIPLGKEAGFLPAMRMTLTPFGPEWIVDIFLKLPKEMVGQFYVRIGSKVFRSFWGVGAKIEGIQIVKKLSMGAGFDIFSQPEINAVYAANSAYLASAKAGFALYLDFTYNPIRVLKLYTRLGYKTDGYVFGMALKKTFIWHLGLGLYL